MPELDFQCPLRHGLHARPASTLAEQVERYQAEVELVHVKSGARANARSVLEVVGLDIRDGDACRLCIDGPDAERAARELREFVERELPGCDAELPPEPAAPAGTLPRALRAGEPRFLAGSVVCPGIGRGRVVLVRGVRIPEALIAAPGGTPAAEREKLSRARSEVRAALESRLRAGPGAVEEGILRAHLSILRDVGMADRIEAAIGSGASALRAVADVAGAFAARLRVSDSGVVRERAFDVEDIAQALAERIHGEPLAAGEPPLDEDSVVVAESLTPRQFLALDRRRLRALVLEHTGATSHAVILARSFGVPTLTGVADGRASLAPGATAVVDAGRGLVFVDPGPEVLRFYERERATLRRRAERLARHTGAPGRTRDGVALEVAANVATVEELVPAFAAGADGIGLFRTEMLFLDREAPPSEDEQFAIYAEAARSAQGRAVILRTFDVGGDKPVPYLDLPPEKNPFLGRRGVRVYPAYEELFRVQLRAILRASVCGRVWVMLPMVNSAAELHWARERLAEARAELDARGEKYDPEMRVGVMVEVPAAALAIRDLSAGADFFSIGTNDLLQYFMAVDREDARVAALASARAPAFLRLLKQVVDDVRAAGRWVGMCGEMTRSPRNLPLLVGLGLDEISTAAPEIPAIKSALAGLSAADCRGLLERALGCASIAEVEELVAAFRARGSSEALVEAELVRIGSDSRSKEEAIAELVGALHAAGRTDAPQALEDAVWAREAVYSTGLGHGFAIPHCKSDAAAASTLAVLRLAEPIDWGSSDGQPVRCVFLLALRESDPGNTHMKVFSKLARRLMHEGFRERMLAARDTAEVLSCLDEELGLSQIE